MKIRRHHTITNSQSVIFSATDALRNQGCVSYRFQSVYSTTPRWARYQQTATQPSFSEAQQPTRKQHTMSLIMHIHIRKSQAAQAAQPYRIARYVFDLLSFPRLGTCLTGLTLHCKKLYFCTSNKLFLHLMRPSNQIEKDFQLA